MGSSGGNWGKVVHPVRVRETGAGGGVQYYELRTGSAEWSTPCSHGACPLATEEECKKSTLKIVLCSFRELQQLHCCETLVLFSLDVLSTRAMLLRAGKKVLTSLLRAGWTRTWPRTWTRADDFVGQPPLIARFRDKFLAAVAVSDVVHRK